MFSIAPFEIGIASLILMLALILIGMNIAFTMLAVSCLGVFLMRGDLDVMLSLFVQAANDTVASYEFGVVPMFVLMGMIVGVADMGKDLFGLANAIWGRLKGGLGIATVFANAIFAAITGISIASASVFTKVAVPEMLKYGYTGSFATGVVAGSSVLGMLIPPSLLMILYAFLAQQSVGTMFLAGILPGLILGLVYSIGIMCMARFWPGFVMRATHVRDVPSGNLGGLAIRTVPIIFLIVFVLGGIYGGIFNATDAGAAGAIGALAIGVLRRRLSWKSGWKIASEAGTITVIVLFLIIAANLYSRMLTLAGVPQFLIEWVNHVGFGVTGFMVMYVILIILLGCIIDSASIMLLVLPLTLPVVSDFGVDLVWFGVITVIAVEIGLLTPPLGLSVLTIHSTLENGDITVGDIFRGSLPFVLLMIITLVLLIIFPQLSLALT